MKMQWTERIKFHLRNYKYFEVIEMEEEIIIKTIWNDISLDTTLKIVDNKLEFKDYFVELNDLWCVLYENAMDHYELIMKRLHKAIDVN